MDLLVSICVGIATGFTYGKVRRYMKKNNLKFNWKWIRKVAGITLIVILITWIIYSIIGLIVADTYIKENGNICKGFPYGFKVCSGDINKE